MKHLNPRQGITTERDLGDARHVVSIECETPKSPPGDYNPRRAARRLFVSCPGVKHLNPRQGITTHRPVDDHNIPKQCETPKSPPGDYNMNAARGLAKAAADAV